MLLPGSIKAPPACLRCQLRQVLAGLRAQRLPAPPRRLRQLSTTANHRQDESEAQLERRPRSRNADRDYVYRHIHPEGRIIGKPGRRQRQSSGQLATNSLGKPSEVILIHDVVEEPKQQRRLVVAQAKEDDAETSSTPLSAEDIEAAITGKRQTPEQEEVNASIDELRPEGNVVETSEFGKLSKTLLDSYNARQLARYLLQSLSSAPASPPAQTPARKKDKSVPVDLHATQWRPGRTSLEERIGRLSFTKSDLGTTKARLIDQIMRLAWDVTIYSEEQQLGELELYLKPWQMKMLFDLKFDGKPGFESFIESPLLRRTTDVRPYRPDNVLRITARRRDAEEVVRKIHKKFASVRQLDMNLNVFKSLIGQTGWPDSLDDLFRANDLKYVSELTGSIIEPQPGGKITIYSVLEHEQHAAHTRRLLLSLLQLPSPKTTSAVVPSDRSEGAGRKRALKTYAAETENLTLADSAAADLHRRYDHLALTRLTAPVARCAEPEQQTTPKITRRPEYAIMGGTDGRRRWQRLVGMLDAMPSTLPPIASNNSDSTQELRESAWRLSRGGQPSQWAVKFCVLLRSDANHAKSSSSTSSDAAHLTEAFITSYQIPALSQLLSYFTPTENFASAQQAQPSSASRTRYDNKERAKPYLVAHFMPSPFSTKGIAALRTLPRISVTYTIDTKVHTGRLRIIDVKADLRKQEVQVLFPEQAADLAFTRSSTMYMKIVTRHRSGFDRIEAFTQQLQDSMNATQGGTLDAMPELDIRLPWWVIQKHRPHKIEEAKEDIAVPYMLDRLEQVEGINFVPSREKHVLERMGSEVRQLFEKWPEGMMLRVREVEAGAFGGRRTELRLINRLSAASQTSSAPALDNSDEGGSDGSDGDAGKKDKTLKNAKAAAEEGAAESATQSLTVIALRLLGLLTRANAGTLPEVNVS